MAVGEEVAGAEDPSWIRIPLISGLKPQGRSTKAQPLLKPLTMISVERSWNNTELQQAQKVRGVEPEPQVGRIDSSARRIQLWLHISRYEIGGVR